MAVVYAQTNLQLYNQMRMAGYSDADRAVVHRVYDVGVLLFTAKFRGSGKPLLSHLVGTASVLCALNARVELIAGALLHAAYIFGEFGDGRPGVTPEKREFLRQAIGEEIEDIVARYQALDWRRPSIGALVARLDPLPPDERDVLMIRLANELEDHLDLGVLYCGNADERRGEILSSLHACAELARRIGEPLLAAELERVFGEVGSSQVPEGLRHPRDYTYLLPPASCMPRPSVSIRRVLDRHPRLARLLGRRKVLFRGKRQEPALVR